MIPRRPNLECDNGFIKPVQDRTEHNTVFISPFTLTLGEISETFAFNTHRKVLFSKLETYFNLLWSTGCRPLVSVIGGSFLDDVEKPGDIDLSHVVRGIPDAATPLLMDKAFVRERFSIDVMTIAIEKLGMRQMLQIMRISTFYGYRKDGMMRATIAIVPPDF